MSNHAHVNQNKENIENRQKFLTRVSLLDDCDDNSHLKQNSYFGFYNCLIVIVFFYFFSNPMIQWKKTGSFFDDSLLNMMKQDFLLCLISWPIFYIWSHLAFVFQLLLLKGVPKWIIILVQHGSQCCMFLYTQYIVTTRNWGVTQALYVTIQSCVFFMKMHSFSSSNQQLHQQWIQQGRNNSNSPSLYPNNINIKNFTLYLWMPVLVYEIEYPRTQNIRIRYLIKKCLITLLLIFLDYIIVVEHILHVIYDKDKFLIIESVCQIILPVIAVFLITFLMVFDNYLNIFAEITKFGDRLYYTDWWNSNGLEEFNRKWNRTVHLFLHRHVYQQAIAWKLNKKYAKALTFTFSAALHEYTIAVSLQKITPILTVFMVMQVPLILSLQKQHKFFKSNQFVWLALMLGFSFTIVLYIKFDEILDQGFFTLL